jgi:hypothetical protein
MPDGASSSSEARRQAIEVAHSTAFLGIPLATAVPFTLDGAARIVHSVFAYDAANDEGTGLASAVVLSLLLVACAVVLATPAILSLFALRRVETAASPGSKTRAPAPVIMVLIDIGSALGLGAWLASGLPVPTELGKATATFTPAAAGLLTVVYGVLSLAMLVVGTSSKARATWE